MKKLLCLVLSFLIFAPAFAQQKVEMADAMRSSGKIYVVIGTVMIVFAGLVIYLFALDRRLKRLEKK